MPSEKAGSRVLLGIVIGLAVLWALPLVRGLLPRFVPEAASQHTGEAAQVPSQTQALEQERKLLNEQTQSMQKEARSLHDERIETIAARYRRGKEREYDRIVLANECPADVAVALYYLDLDEQWITRGWWQVPPGGSLTTDAMTRNRYLYLYAENKRLERTWDGAGTPDGVDLTVSDSKFDHVKGDSFLYEEPRSVSFFRKDTGESWTDFKVTFQCLAEAPPR
jgi:uncharacterized membrane protein